MEFRLNINLDNDAFQGPDGRHEIAQILKECARKIEDGSKESSLRDINGNKVGKYAITQD